MSRKRPSGTVPWSVEANHAYQRAEECWRQGRHRAAFRFFLVAANAGVVPAFGTVAQSYDWGDGVKADENAALYWYRRAYRHGDYSAANNIGCIWRDRNKLGRALMWFHRAVKLGDADANINIAKVWIGNKKNPQRATHYLKKVLKSRHATLGSKEEPEACLRNCQ
jgi:FOG: TPR repeat, SEL1 subfamily